MVTLVDLTDREIADLKELTNEASVTRAVRAAMREYVRYARRLQLLQRFSGRIEMLENHEKGQGGELASG